MELIKDLIGFLKVRKKYWLLPMILVLLLFAISNGEIQHKLTVNIVDAKQVGILLYGPYLLAVEIASFLLLAGLIAGYHYAKPDVTGGHL